MTFTLTPDTEAALLTLAERHGQAPEIVLESLVTRAAEEERERQETLDGLHRSAEEFAAGGWTTPEQLDATLRAYRPFSRYQSALPAVYPAMGRGIRERD